MKRKITAILIAFMICIISLVPSEKVYAEDGSLDDKIIDYIFEYAKYSSYVLMGTYQMDGIAKIMGYEGDNSPGQMTRDFVSNGLENVKYNVKEARDAVKNVWSGLTETVKNNWRNFYNNFKGVNIVIDAEIMPQLNLELNIDAFNKSIVNNTVIQFPTYDEMNYRETEGDSNPNYSFDVMGNNDWQNQLTGVFPNYGKKLNETTISAITQAIYELRKKSINDVYIQFYECKNSTNTVESHGANGYRRFISISNKTLGFICNSESSSYYYPKFIIPEDTQVSLLQIYENGYYVALSIASTPYESFSTKPLTQLNIKTIYLINTVDAPVKEAVQEIKNFYENTEQFVNYETINNYYNYEYIPAAQNIYNEEGDYIDNRYYDYTTNNTYNNTYNYENVVNNSFYTETINNYIYNNTYTGGNITQSNSNVTYITNVNQIPGYVAPIVITPAPTSVPTPVPTPVPTQVPTPVPTPDPTPVPTSVPTPTPTNPTPIPEENGEKDSFWDWLKGIFEGVKDTLDFFDKLRELFEWLFNKIRGFLIPADGFLEGKVEEIKLIFDEKIPMISQILNLQDELKTQLLIMSGGGKSSRVNGSDIDISNRLFITLPPEYGGITIEVIDFTIFDRYRSYIHGLIIAMAYVWFIIRIVKKITKII